MVVHMVVSHGSTDSTVQRSEVQEHFLRVESVDLGDGHNPDGLREVGIKLYSGRT